MENNNKELIAKKLENIAEHFADLQSAELSDYRDLITITLKDGTRFYLSHNHGRISARPEWPKYGVEVPEKHRWKKTYSLGHNDTPEITCNITRESKSIARDVEARFLPYYRPLYAKACQLAQEATEKEQKALDLIQELTGKPANDHSGDPRAYVHGATIRTYDGESVTFERLDVTASQARRIMEILQPKNQLELSGEK